MTLDGQLLVPVIAVHPLIFAAWMITRTLLFAYLNVQPIIPMVLYEDCGATEASNNSRWHQRTSSMGQDF